MKTKQQKKFYFGFTLVELLAVMSIIAILASFAIFPFYGLIEQARLSTERETLAVIADEIKASFRQDDLDKNVSALVGEIPATILPTVFDLNAQGSYNAEAWYARLARRRGQDTSMFSDTTPWENINGAVKDIAMNGAKSRRLLIVGPSFQNDIYKDVQCYILLSFMFNTDGDNVTLSMSSPPADGVRATYCTDDSYGVSYRDWFKTIYDHDWGVATSAPNTAPYAWGGDWQSRGITARTFAQKVLAVKIVQPRNRVTVNNQSQPGVIKVGGVDVPYDAETAFIYTNIRGEGGLLESGIIKHSVAPSRSETYPAQADRGILEGRRLLIQRGAPLSAPTDQTKVFSLLLNEPSTFTIQ